MMPRISRKFIAFAFALAACGEAERPSLDEAVRLASRASVECGLGDQVHDILWGAYSRLPVTLATQPTLHEAPIAKNSSISFDARAFEFSSPTFQFVFSVTTGTASDEPHALSTIRFTAAYQDRTCRESCAVTAKYGDVMHSDKSSTKGVPLAYACRQPFYYQTIAYTWEAIALTSGVSGELVAGYREIIHANYKGRTAVLDIHPRGTDRFCVDGDCESADISSWDLRSLISGRFNPTTYMPSQFFGDHPDFPSDPQLW